MTSVIWTTTVDCGDPYALSVWWSTVLDYAEDPADPNLPEHEECLITSADGRPKLLFIRVPEGKPDQPRTVFADLPLRAVASSASSPIAPPSRAMMTTLNGEVTDAAHAMSASVASSDMSATTSERQ